MASPLNPLEGTTLHHLLSEDENRLLDAIDELRSQGVGKLLGETGLPQIIVCGDQSSGKSSVLEALTRVRFPTRSSVCTTFPTELRLRREPISRISCLIKPSPSRSEAEKERLARFSESFESPERFSDLITAARACMSASSNAGSSAFFEDILQVEIVGPKMAPLTIVDLPGLIHYRNSSSRDDDIKLVQNLVERYMKLDNSIILAVVSAHNDINNQVILNKIEKTAQYSKRTLGIITKPDELPSGSEKEQEYLEHVQSNPNKFHYGWHVVRNRSYEEQSTSFEERDEKETKFLSSSNWSSLPRRRVGLGIDSLRQKLSEMLLEHISTSLPSIVHQLENDLNQSNIELTKLGEARSTQDDQYKYLSDVSDAFGEYVKDALSGRYHRRPFFGDPLSPEGLEKRLRANIRNFNDQFAIRMLERGHKWHVLDDAEWQKTQGFLPSLRLDHPNVISKSKFLKECVDTLAFRERGSELPGMSNPVLVGSLFHQQSEPWNDLASEHLDAVWKAVGDFLEALLAHLTDERTCNQLLIHVIDPAMDARKESLRKKLEELMLPHRDHDPLDIDPHFARKTLSLREKRVATTVIEQIRQGFDVDGAKSLPTADQLVAKLAVADPAQDSKYGSVDTFEFMQAYYESSILIFINNVAALAVEQCLLTGLAKIFSPTTVRDMDGAKLALIASESRDTLSERIRLSERVTVLRKGLQTIRRIQPVHRAPRSEAESNQNKSPSPSNASTIRTTSATTGLFRSAAEQPANKPAMSGLFGKPHVNTPATSGMFGSIIEQTEKKPATPGGMFSKPATPGLFCSPTISGSGLFINPATAGTFGISRKQPDNKLGTSGGDLFSKPATVGTFGSATKRPEHGPATSGGDLLSKPATSSMFGSPDKQPENKLATSGGGLFSKLTTVGTFGSPDKQPETKPVTSGGDLLSKPVTVGTFGSATKQPENKPATGGTFGSEAEQPAIKPFGF